MHNMIERPTIYLNSFNVNPGFSYSKRKYLDEALNEYYGDSYLGLQINNQHNENINRWNPKFQGIDNKNSQILNHETFNSLNTQSNYYKNKHIISNKYASEQKQSNYSEINLKQKQNQRHTLNKFSHFETPRLFSSSMNINNDNNSNQNIPIKAHYIQKDFTNQQFALIHNKIVMIETDTLSHTKFKKQNDLNNNDQRQIIKKKSMVDLKNHQQQQNNSKLNRKFPTFNNGSMLNSLADYNLNNLDDKMFNLNIDYSRNDLKNMSLDSLINSHVSKMMLHKNSCPPKDEFAAYRLTENEAIQKEKPESPKSKTIKNKFSSISSYNCSKLGQETILANDKTSSADSSPTNLQPKKNRHHHHRAKRSNRNKNKNGQTNSEAMKKSQSSLYDCAQNENQDSLSAFDFSNTDEFWEDDIVINSELIEADKFMSDEIKSPLIKFSSISCDSLNGILMEADKFDLKESIIKDKLYEDILDFKDNLSIN